MSSDELLLFGSTGAYPGDPAKVEESREVPGLCFATLGKKDTVSPPRASLVGPLACDVRSESPVRRWVSALDRTCPERHHWSLLLPLLISELWTSLGKRPESQCVLRFGS